MNCHETQTLLSAYYDNELSNELHSTVAGHVQRCGQCADALAGYRRLSAAFSHSTTPAVRENVWLGIATELDARSKQMSSSDAETKRWRRATFQRFAIAAAMLLVIGLGVWMSHDDAKHSHSVDEAHSQEFVATMEHYLQILSEDPEVAERFLLDKYSGRVVEPENAVMLVGYRPTVANGLPEGYSLASTSVLKMPCCTCVKTVCKRQDGSALVLFEHDDEKAAWFGERPSRLAMCGDKECCLVDLDSSIAATWKQGSRSVTAVGLQNEEEAARFVDWFEEKI
ncbi:anti-sigma factor family protein [Novipirellula sp. SH528]|uniref:anti-sigma factor family protein n=1 Tax=Novipirellula sp. SH528 TaxID=3454466 RepID=UPI003F9F9273